VREDLLDDRLLQDCSDDLQRAGKLPVVSDGRWPVLRGQRPVVDGVSGKSISRTPRTEPSGILIDPEETLTDSNSSPQSSHADTCPMCDAQLIGG